MSTGLGKYFGANFLEDNAKMYVLLTISTYGITKHISIPGTQRGSPVISSSTLSPCGYVYRQSMFELSHSTHTHTHTHSKQHTVTH